MMARQRNGRSGAKERSRSPADAGCSEIRTSCNSTSRTSLQLYVNSSIRGKLADYTITMGRRSPKSIPAPISSKTGLRRRSDAESDANASRGSNKQKPDHERLTRLRQAPSGSSATRRKLGSIPPSRHLVFGQKRRSRRCPILCRVAACLGFSREPSRPPCISGLSLTLSRRRSHFVQTPMGEVTFTASETGHMALEAGCFAHAYLRFRRQLPRD
jgi:hypothetical protein